MELLTGGELFERIKNKKILTEREVSIIMKNLVSAIQYIHSQGIVHRDIKPENVIFSDCTENAKLKIVDFGFAKLKPSSSSASNSSSSSSSSLQTPCFTLNYAAPEVLSKAINFNSSNGYDESCDLWSLGVILHTMLSGQVPFCGSGLEPKPVTSMQNEIIEKIKNSSKSLDLKHKPWNTISESAKSLVKGLLNIDPKKRLTLKEITRHEWLRDCNNFDVKPLYYENCLATPKLLLTSSNSQIVLENDALKQLKMNINRTYNAYHEAEKQGLLKIELKAVFEAPLAQRRRNKRSTSSNASSESNVSTNSISSSLSTSTTSMNNCASSTNTSSYTPTKKCPSSCGKLGEQTIFNFTDNCINEYLDQANKRPVTRSITNSKLGATNIITTTSEISLPFSNSKYNDIPKIDPSSSATSGKQIANVGVKHCLELDIVNSESVDQQQQQQMSLGPVPPLSKRLKRCSTILID